MGETNGKFIFDQILTILEKLEQKNICHRNLSLKSFMVDKNLNLKLTNFEDAERLENVTPDCQFGTESYEAPESIEKNVQNGHKSDIFSAGVILFMLVQGFFPFDKAEKSEFIYKNIIKSDHYKFWTLVGDNGLSDSFKELVVNMLSFDPNNRLSAKEIRSQNWMLKVPDLNLGSEMINTY